MHAELSRVAAEKEAAAAAEREEDEESDTEGKPAAVGHAVVIVVVVSLFALELIGPGQRLRPGNNVGDIGIVVRIGAFWSIRCVGFAPDIPSGRLVPALLGASKLALALHDGGSGFGHKRTPKMYKVVCTYRVVAHIGPEARVDARAARSKQGQRRARSSAI